MNSSPSSADAKPSVGNARSSARLAAVQALYEMDMVGVGADPVLEEFLKQRWTPKPGDETGDEDQGLSDIIPPDGSFMAILVRGVSENSQNLDDMIDKTLSDKWTVERLEVLLRAILRSGTFELLTLTDVPARVIINEYVDVAKAFYEDTQPGLINGVLDRLARTLRASEMDSD